MAAEKALWRERFRAARRALAPDARARASAEIVARASPLLDAALADAPGDAVALFWPLADEPDLRPLAYALRQSGVAVALPVVAGPGRLEWRAFGGADRLADGPWGLRQPDAASADVPPERLAAVVVPGLAFGRDGSRLGYGGGFYDRALSRTPALRVGVAFAAALVAAVPAEPHDQRLDAVVTDHDRTWTHRSRPAR